MPLSGALLDEDGKTVIGGISLNDPYEKAGIRKETVILKWRQRWWNGQFSDD